MRSSDCARILARATDHEDRIVACDRSGDLVAPHGINGRGEEVRSPTCVRSTSWLSTLTRWTSRAGTMGETNIGLLKASGCTSIMAGAV